MSDRPAFHFTPPSMWMNDPNGLVYFDGEYHLFYQYHPLSTVWGPMHWGHAVSADLVNWKHLPIALSPDEFGMIYSGSAVVDWENTAGFGRNALVAIFTYHKNHVESQNIAYSLDRGRTWTKYAGNPVIPAPNPPRDFRDPKVFWNNDHWALSLAAKDEILFFVSPDLKRWEASGSFGRGHGTTAGVWETPDLFELRVDDTDETRWVLTVGIGDGESAGGSGTQYFIGDFDGKCFVSGNPKETILWADFGADFYAAQSWNDEPHGRRLILAWMNNWQYANLIPASDWRSSLSVIRELSLTRTVDGIRLRSRPAPELRSVRGAHHHWEDITVQPGENLLAKIHEAAFELDVTFRVSPEMDRFGIRVRVGENEHTDVIYAVNDEMLLVDRAHSGQTNFKDGFAKVHSASLAPISGMLRLQIFADQSSVEVFANDGLVTLSDCIFPSAHSRGLDLFVQGGSVKIESLDVYSLMPARSNLAEEKIPHAGTDHA